MRRALLLLRNGLTKEEARREGIDLYQYRKRGWIKKRIVTEEYFDIPKNAPRWAKLWKFTRKKYGITTETTSKNVFYLNPAGLRALKRIDYSDKFKKIE